jgi:CRISPR/Cas system CSM-associated protein Csm3 (group 7 of RAMP superfamily)
LEVEATLRNDLHVAGVGRTVVLIDRCIERDAQGRALIPATSFKGRTRAHYERLLSALGYDLKGCKPPNPATMCNDPNDLCPVCQLFGSPMQQGRIEFTDLVPDTSAEPTTRIGIGVNRKLNTVAEGRLFFYEAAPAQPNRFRGQIRGWATETEIALLLGALKLITHFGGQKARGLGRAEVKPTALHIRRNGAWETVNPSQLLATLQEVRP